MHTVNKRLVVGVPQEAVPTWVTNQEDVMECVVANVLVGGGCVETAVFTKDVWTTMIAVQEMASSVTPAVLVYFLVVFVALDIPAESLSTIF